VIQLPAEKLETKEATHTVVDHLTPRTVYSFNVSAYFLDSETWGRPRRIDVETQSDGKYSEYGAFCINLYSPADVG